VSTLTDRLRGIVRAPQRRDAESPRDRSSSDLERLLGGAWHDDGRCFIVERRIGAERPHGCAEIGALASHVQRAARDATLVEMLTGGAPAPAPYVFFDLETTGLSGGAGTHAFLVGCGWFDEDGSFAIRQHLLTRYAVERRMLEFLNAGAIVSFNGKSFDAPLLDTRYLFHRLEWNGSRLPHIDALHPSRRFWRQSAAGLRESCSLPILEHEVLGVARRHDVAGFEIPARYFHFVRSGDAEPLVAVLEHNRLDLLSLAGLFARLLDLVREGPASVGTAWEALALGRTYARAGLEPSARASLERAVDLARTGGVEPGIEALRALALLHRRARRHEEAARCWRQLLEAPACPASFAREANEALAIHHEHRVRDLVGAKTFALRSLTGEGNGKNGEGWNDAVRHRLQRLERKMAAGPPSGRPLFPSWPLPPSCGSRTSAPRTSS